jgi:ribosome biogenesis GTPase
VHTLEEWGWNPFLANEFAKYDGETLVPARVIGEGKNLYRLATSRGEALARVSGKMRFNAASRELQRCGMPVVGDWVAVRVAADGGRAVIQAVLPRRSKVSRAAAGRATEEQIVAANIDTLFVITSCDRDFNPRRIERYVAMAWESGARPVVLLNKVDLCPDPSPYLREAQSAALGVPAHAMSAQTGEGLEALGTYFRRGQTVGLAGMSGVGKTTLLNRLLGEERFSVRAIRGDGRGRHATSSRNLVVLPPGGPFKGLVLDTPGMRELQLWAGGDAVEHVFEEIAALTANCRFRNCSHGAEPGCAVQAALRSGRLDSGRWENYRKLIREQEYLARRKNAALEAAHEKKWRKIHKELSQRIKWEME